MYCDMCGIKLTGTELFCTNCGQKLNDNLNPINNNENNESIQNKEYKEVLPIGGSRTIIFTDDNFIIRTKNGDTLYNYSDVYKVNIPKYNTHCVYFKFGSGSSLKDTCYIDFDTNQKERDELYKFLLDKFNKAQHEKFQEELKEHIIKCNTCGNIFCYTGADIERNKKHDSEAFWADCLGIMSGLFGTKYDMYEQTKISQDNKDKIIDFSKCPKCNSKNIVEIDSNETYNINKIDQTKKTNNVEEIKKYKELLDTKIITQEEFDKKKKELLDL